MKLYKVTLPPTMQNESNYKNIQYVASNTLAEVSKTHSMAHAIELITDDLKLL